MGCMDKEIVSIRRNLKTGKRVEQIKVLATKPDNQSLIPRTHIVERKKLYPDPHILAVACVPTDINTNTQIN